MASKNHMPTPVRRAIGELADSVSTWRKLQGLTQAELADRAGVGTQTLSRLERGDGGVSVENLMRVLRALGVVRQLTDALDPYGTDVGRLRADEQLPQRVRRRRVAG